MRRGFPSVRKPSPWAFGERHRASIVIVEHDMHVAAGSDWVIDMGPGAGKSGGRIVAAGLLTDVAKAHEGKRNMGEDMGSSDSSLSH
jgi:hypothetical protein